MSHRSVTTNASYTSTDTSYLHPHTTLELMNPLIHEDTSTKVRVRIKVNTHSTSKDPHAPTDFTPLPSPLPIPPFPHTPHCSWSFNPSSRVILAHFHDTLHPDDERFLRKMMQRDDLTVVCDNVLSKLTPELWNLGYMAGVAGEMIHTKVRRFDRTDHGVMELDGFLPMTLKEYHRYLERRAMALKEDTCKREMRVNSGEGIDMNVLDTSLYWLDYNMATMVPKVEEEFRERFLLKGCLPGADYCMLNAVSEGGRPFMGPNLYITPPSAFTHFHQDGHGTVDSGHMCLAGYNEVVMLRRMTEEQKRHALHVLHGGKDRKEGNFAYDALYGTPHGDGNGTKPMWPNHNAIEVCRTMNYCPSVFILKPGQFVHINKGRLHAFRKLASYPLPESDCHATLRADLIQTEQLTGKEAVCMSVAWDWMYKGITAEGIHNELVSTLLCASLNRKHLKQSLAIPETCLLHMAKICVSEYEQEQLQKKGQHHNIPLVQVQLSTKTHTPSSRETLQGLLPSLRYLVQSNITFLQTIESKQNDTREERVSINVIPNAWENPDTMALDPFGNGDFFCKICHHELSNVYMHCDGCEEKLNKEFNICSMCHAEGLFRASIQMHPLRNDRHSSMNHIGNFNYNRKTKCPCKRGPCCQKCTFCLGCSCRCHRAFTLLFRFMDMNGETELLRRVEGAVGDSYASNSVSTRSVQCLYTSAVPLMV